MAVKVEQVDAALIDTVCSRVREKLDAHEAPQLEEFVREYYRWVPPDDLVGRDALDLYGAALSHWKFLERRAPGEAKVRVYNPSFEQHGWESTHTVVEMVTDDMPFLVDSVTMELTHRSRGFHLLIHPVVRVRRDEDGRVTEVLPTSAPDGEGQTESVIHAEVDRETAPAELEALRGHLLRMLGEVRASVEDWPLMRERVQELIDELDASPPPSVDPVEVEEAKALLTWLDDEHFTFLGYREYDLLAEDSLLAVEGSGLGILRRDGRPTEPSAGFARLPPRARALARSPRLLNITKANSRATVHRPSYLDYIGVKRFDRSGAVVGERRFLGLYTTAAYRASVRDVPLLRRKVEAVMSRAAFPPGGHNEKGLLEILDTYPRDELFQISVDELFAIAMGILALGERQRVRLFVRRDEYERYLSCLLFLPRDRFNTQNRLRAQEILSEAFGADSIDWALQLSESVLVRLHFIARTRPGELPHYDVADIEARIVEATRSWVDDLHDALVTEIGEEQGNELFYRYGQAFPTAYRADWVARSAVADIRRIERLPEHGGLAVSLYRPLEAPAGELRCKLLRAGTAASLSDVLPILQNLGLRVGDERPYEVRPREGPPSFIYDFGLSPAVDGTVDIDAVRDRFHDAFTRVWHGQTDDDGMNALVLRTALSWRQITILRATARYLRQAGTAFSNAYMEQALLAHPGIAGQLVELFCARFDPAGGGDTDAAEELAAAIEERIDRVESLDEDRILRNFLTVICATLRTNYFQLDADGGPKSYLSFKLDPERIPVVPAPRPRFEIFVYSPRTEGVHLRGGRVARGGLRWSDRREDFRTEILGLMKAQMVKNAVIVPVGAKGGFVVKRPPAGGREALLDEVVACYRTFICGLLDLTDNIVEGRVVPPRDVVRYDEDDPYLVVAADKGTATFSDIANGIAAEYGFWLGDAFASGGSAGYDHKKMGITARGAWESVKRHFRELGVDVQSEDFTVVGIGDMSGDVFGNGMLLSPHIRLVGAFDHRHVFLDPDPDAETSYAERRRVFELPRSSWADYDRSLISEGGGVWPRTAKSIPLAGAVREALDIEAERLTPTELIRALLRAPVDLLWNGGIGTYVKASSETHADAGDKANDAVRVNASELRCRVIGEGGNLGLTQRGRIEFALSGGCVNTDAIDNVGGVNTSDREVNIKVLLNSVVTDGDLTVKQRNELLAEMTDAVADAVLHDSYRQTQALTLASAQAGGMLHVHDRFMRSLEQSRRLDRALEFLPDADAIAERGAARLGLTQPELAVLLAYSKVTLYAELLESGLPEDPHLSEDLARYFPAPLPERFADALEGHRLRREIIATRVANSIVDRAGITFVWRLREETGAGADDVARAYAVARSVFEMRPLWEQIEALDNRVEADTQVAMLLQGRKLVERATRWLLRNRRSPLDIAVTLARYAPGARTVSAAVPGVLVDADREAWEKRVARLGEAGVPAALAERAATLDALFSALDVVEVAEATGCQLEEVVALHFLLGGQVRLHWLRDRIAALPRDDRWQTMARAALRDDLFALHGELTADVLESTPDQGDAAARLQAWTAANAGAVERCLAILSDIDATGTFDLTTLPVALREVRTLIRSTAPDPAAAHRWTGVWSTVSPSQASR